jgi:hypothetical protein
MDVYPNRTEFGSVTSTRLEIVNLNYSDSDFRISFGISMMREHQRRRPEKLTSRSPDRGRDRLHG